MKRDNYIYVILLVMVVFNIGMYLSLYYSSKIESTYVSDEEIINNTIDNDNYIYYKFLSDENKILYDEIVKSINDIDKSIVIEGKYYIDDVNVVMESIFNDHPEMFWINTKFKYTYDKYNVCREIIFDYNDLVNDIDNNKRIFDEKCNYIIDMAMEYDSDLEREKFIHDYLINNISYDMDSDINQSAFSAIVYGKTVCAGYSRVFQYLMNKIGITTYYCEGNDNHVWNIVYIDNRYYNVDLTWDDDVYRYRYYNKSDNDFINHERMGLSINLPKCV